MGLAQRRRRGPRHHVAAGGDDPQAAEVGQRRPHDLAEEAGGEVRPGDPARADQSANRGRVGSPRRDQDQLGPRRQRPPDLQRREVELGRCDREADVVGLGQGGDLGAEQVADLGFADFDPFRHPGRARGEEDVGEAVPVGQRRRPTVAGGEQLDLQRRRIGRQPGDRLAATDRHRRRGQADQGAQPLRRAVGADRHVGGAGADRAEDGDEVADRARQADPDQVALADPALAQGGGDGGGACLQLGVGERHLALADRHRPRRLGGMAADDRGELGREHGCPQTYRCGTARRRLSGGRRGEGGASPAPACPAAYAACCGRPGSSACARWRRRRPRLRRSRRGS